MAFSKRTIKTFEMGEFPHFLIWAVLEWILIASLYLDGFVAFMSSTFAKIFDLEPPCVLCTRVDHALVSKDPNMFYNDSICECHKKDISLLAYCHVHRKLADVRNMCEACLLSFATEKDNDLFMEDNRNVRHIKTVTDCSGRPSGTADVNKCSCCGEPLKTRASSISYARSCSNLHVSSPRTCFTPTTWKTEDSRYTEVKFTSDTESDMSEYDLSLGTDVKHSEEMNDVSPRTLNLLKSNNIFGIPLADSSLANKILKKTSLENPDLHSLETNDESSGDGDSSLQYLKKQARIDRKTVLTLSKELDEERSAAAVAANNAMAMITRLQAEKAAVQMEASQYQRMMEEQTEYEQEALQILKDLLDKRDEEVKAMESELESYREKYGELRKVGSEECEVDADEYYQEWRSQSLSSFDEKSDPGNPLERDGDDDSGTHFGRDEEFGSPNEQPVSPLERDQHEPISPMDDEDDESHSGRSIENERVTYEESLLDFETEKYQLYGMLKNLENHIQSSSLDDEWDEEDTDTVQENRASLKREVSLIRDRLRALEADSGFLKHTAMTLQKGEKGAELLTEIAQHLRKMRNSESEDVNIADT